MATLAALPRPLHTPTSLATPSRPLLSPASLATPPRPSLSPASRQDVDLDTLVPALLERHEVPGASVAVAVGDRIAYQRAFGFKRTRPEEAAGPDTVYEAASLSKPVFAYVVLRMAERGDIDLDRSLTDYLPEPYIAAEPLLEKLTARLVLCHRSGFPNWARDEPLGFRNEPGERFGYSGEGYVYLQRVVEHLEDKPLEEVMRERLLDPLGMDSSSYVWLSAYEQSSAAGHNRRGIQIRKSRPDAANAAASLHTSARDYARFLGVMLAPAGRSSAALGEHTLSDMGIAAMLSAQTDVNDSVKWGLGWGLEMVPEETSFWHWGDNGPFKAFAFCSRKQDKAVIILTNSSHGLKLAPPIVNALFPGEHPALSFRMIDY